MMISVSLSLLLLQVKNVEGDKIFDSSWNKSQPGTWNDERYDMGMSTHSSFFEEVLVSAMPTPSTEPVNDHDSQMWRGRDDFESSHQLQSSSTKKKKKNCFDSGCETSYKPGILMDENKFVRMSPSVQKEAVFYEKKRPTLKQTHTIGNSMGNRSIGSDDNNSLESSNFGRRVEHFPGNKVEVTANNVDYSVSIDSVDYDTGLKNASSGHVRVYQYDYAEEDWIQVYGVTTASLTSKGVVNQIQEEIKVYDFDSSVDIHNCVTVGEGEESCSFLMPSQNAEKTPAVWSLSHADDSKWTYSFKI